jgi:pilus assembly protein CpaB
MNQSRLLAAFSLALLLGLAASFLVYKKLQQGTMRAAASSYRVVMASRDLGIGTKLQPQDLKLAEWPAGSLPSGNFSKTEDVVERAILYPVVAGEPILEAKLAPVGAGAGLTAVIPDGMRAVSIRVDDVVAVAGFVGPGTRVDVLLTGNPGGGRSDGESLTRTILENVQVLAAGQKVQPDAQGRPEKVNVVTLLCNPEDAAKVTLAANDGRIQLVLRNPTDSEKGEKETVVARRMLYGGAAKEAPRPVKVAVRREPAPAPAPVIVEPPPPTTGMVQMIRGDRTAEVEVPLSRAQ